jgi:hypothetical protein
MVHASHAQDQSVAVQRANRAWTIAELIVQISVLARSRDIALKFGELGPGAGAVEHLENEVQESRVVLGPCIIKGQLL